MPGCANPENRNTIRLPVRRLSLVRCYNNSQRPTSTVGVQNESDRLDLSGIRPPWVVIQASFFKQSILNSQATDFRLCLFLLPEAGSIIPTVYMSRGTHARKLYAFERPT